MRATGLDDEPVLLLGIPGTPAPSRAASPGPARAPAPPTRSNSPNSWKVVVRNPDTGFHQEIRVRRGWARRGWVGRTGGSGRGGVRRGGGRCRDGRARMAGAAGMACTPLCLDGEAGVDDGAGRAGQVAVARHPPPQRLEVRLPAQRAWRVGGGDVLQVDEATAGAQHAAPRPGRGHRSGTVQSTRCPRPRRRWRRRPRGRPPSGRAPRSPPARRCGRRRYRPLASTLASSLARMGSGSVSTSRRTVDGYQAGCGRCRRRSRAPRLEVGDEVAPPVRQARRPRRRR